MKGWELLKEIAEGKIKEGTYIEVHDLTVLDKKVCTILYTNRKLNWEQGSFDTSYLLDNNCYFKLIEEEIDIDSIEETDILKGDYTPTPNDMKYISNKINEIIKAVKQLNKKIGE